MSSAFCPTCGERPALQAAALTVGVAAIVLGYRFALLLITLDGF